MRSHSVERDGVSRECVRAGQALQASPLPLPLLRWDERRGLFPRGRARGGGGGAKWAGPGAGKRGWKAGLRTLRGSGAASPSSALLLTFLEGRSGFLVAQEGRGTHGPGQRGAGAGRSLGQTELCKRLLGSHLEPRPSALQPQVTAQGLSLLWPLVCSFQGSCICHRCLSPSSLSSFWFTRLPAPPFISLEESSQIARNI